MAGHMKSRETSLAVALIPGWLRECRQLKIRQQRGDGTYGRGLPEQVSQYSLAELPGMGILVSCSAVLLTTSVHSTSSSSCAAARVSCVTGVVMTLTRESALAMMLSWPEMWRMTVVNCEIKSIWLNWQGEHLSLF